MSEAERMYYGDYGGCSCHINPPCSFCTSMTEEEAVIYWNGGIRGLKKLWSEQGKALTDEIEWVTIFDYERHTW